MNSLTQGTCETCQILLSHWFPWEILLLSFHLMIYLVQILTSNKNQKPSTFELCHEKTCILGCQPGLTKQGCTVSGTLGHRRWIEASSIRVPLASFQGGRHGSKMAAMAPRWPPRPLMTR